MKQKLVCPQCGFEGTRKEQEDHCVPSSLRKVREQLGRIYNLLVLLPMLIVFAVLALFGLDPEPKEEYGDEDYYAE